MTKKNFKKLSGRGNAVAVTQEIERPLQEVIQECNELLNQLAMRYWGSIMHNPDITDAQYLHRYADDRQYSIELINFYFTSMKRLWVLSHNQQATINNLPNYYGILRDTHADLFRRTCQIILLKKRIQMPPN